MFCVCTVPNTVVVSSSLISCIPGVLLRYILNDFGILPVVRVFTGITFLFKFHVRFIYVVRSLCCTVFLTFYLLLPPS